MAQRKEQELKEEERQKMSAVMRRGLPRPLVINTQIVGEANNEAEKLIFEQMVSLMTSDNKKYPAKGMKVKHLPKEIPEPRQYSLDQLKLARQLIEDSVKAPEFVRWPAVTEDSNNSRDPARIFSAELKIMQKEVKRCQKNEGALEVMFKRYKEIASENSQKMIDLNSERDRLSIEHSVF